MVNPNGPLVEAGSDGDNGQTGRKLVMDFYGPRVPIGGGALSGKDLSHIDRIGAYAAREAAVRAVQSGADECLVRLAYAPNHAEPLDVFYDMIGRGERQKREFFSHREMAARYPASAIGTTLAQGRHFFDETLVWNGGIRRSAGALYHRMPLQSKRDHTGRDYPMTSDVRTLSFAQQGSPVEHDCNG